MTQYNHSNNQSTNCGSTAVAASYARLAIMMDTACVAVSILLISLISLRILG